MRKHNKGTKPEQSETLLQRAIRLFEVMDRELQEGVAQAWREALERIDLVFLQLMKDPSIQSATRAKRDVDGPAVELENIYLDLQAQLIQVRQAVAQSIATQKLLEQQVEKARDQADAWLNRATIAERQNNPDLADQARQRVNQYKNAAAELEHKATQQKGACLILRQKLTDFEAKVQQAYVRKQVIVARNKTAQATIIANELFDRLNVAEAFSKIDEVERKVCQSEAQAGKGAPTSVLENLSDQRAFLEDTIKTMQLTIDAISRLELLLEKRATFAEAPDNSDTGRSQNVYDANKTSSDLDE